MDFEGHFEGNSFIHKTNPTIRVVTTLLLSFVIALLTSLNALFTSLLVSIILVFLAELSLLKVSKNLMVFAGFIALIWIVLPFTIKGETLFHLWILKFSYEGLMLCLRITIKSFSIILVFNALISTMNFSVLGAAMQSLKVPLKVVYLFLMTFRYISVLEDEYKRLVTASKIRGFKAGVNILTYKTYGNILGMLFVNANLRGNRVYNAMLCRGFDGRFHTLQVLSRSIKDYFFAFVMFMLIMIIVYLEYLNKV